MPRFQFLLFILFLVACGLTSCKKDCCDIPPGLTNEQLLYTWQLDEKIDFNQTVSKGADIKGRYSLTFNRQYTYIETDLSNGNELGGSWQLLGDGYMINLVTPRGEVIAYNVNASSPTGTGQPTQLILFRVVNSAQETLVFNRVP
jgi:hypothetical protein